MIGEGRKNVLIKDFNTFMYDHTYCYCLQVFRTAEKLRCHFKDYLKINGKQTIKMPKNGEYIKPKKFWKKNKIILKVFQYLRVMKSKIQIIPILTNIKNSL